MIEKTHICEQCDKIADMELRLRVVEKQSTESNILLKNISDQLRELKEEVSRVVQNYINKEPEPKTNPLITTIIVEITKIVTLLITILGALAGYSKFVG